MTVFKYLAIAAAFFALGWQSTFWSGQFINAEGIDGRIQKCLIDQ